MQVAHMCGVRGGSKTRAAALAVGVALLAVGVTLLVQTRFSGGLPLMGPLPIVLVGAVLIVLGWFYRACAPWQLALGVVLAVASAMLVSGTLLVLVEVGETVVLRTVDGKGKVFQTRLFVLDHDGSTWIGAGTGSRRRWFRRLVASPRVDLVRDAGVRCYHAVPADDPAIRKLILARLEEKYRWGQLASAIGNRVLFGKRDPSEAVVIRLDPCPTHGPQG